MADLRATVRALLTCNNECVFCAQSSLAGDRAPRPIDAISDELESARASSDEVTIVGGEPTLHPDLADIVRRARAIGFRRVGLQTNGSNLQARPLADAGLTDVHISIHGATSAAHDYHTAVEGSFQSVLAAVADAQRAELTVVATTVLTRSNARGLSDLARLLRARSVSAWCIAVPRTRGRAADIFDRVVPRLGIAMPFALHAAQTAIGLGLPIFVRGAPLCLLGPFARLSLADAPRAYADACRSCGARGSCPGIEPEYLARFDGDELSARDDTPRNVHELARMFVGEGEVSPPRALEARDAKVRVSLPLANKVRPARAEVPRTAERKTGEALRELFKDLYREDPRD